MFKKLSYFITILIFCLLFMNVNAEEITKSSTIRVNDGNINENLIDDKESTHTALKAGSTISISYTDKIHSIYIVYYKYSDFKATLSNGVKSISVGEDGFLHQYINVIDLLGDVTSLELKYENDVDICDIYVFGEGDLPAFVELWQKPHDHADILLFTTHSDDEQLFFLGLMPTYISRGAYFQVVYLAHHNDNPIRLHEQLHGLYAVGLRNYPIIGIIPDAYSTTLEGAISNLKNTGITTEDIKKFQVEMIRRFKPQVIIGHDEKGEYSHGQHILNTSLLKESIEASASKEYDLGSAATYGEWQVKKVYLHLYGENKITMNYDVPLEYFGGSTAYEVSKEGYKKHNSQQWTWFTGWINGKNNNYKKASEIATYSPCSYGLYFTDVGPDFNKNDIMENLEYYKDIDERKRLEEKEQERYENEKTERAKNKKEYKENNLLVYFAILIVIILIAGVIVLLKSGSKTKKKTK